MTLETDALIARYARNTLLAIIGFGGTVLAWGTLMPIDGAVIGPGTVVIDGNVKKVQHQAGGVIGSVLVKEGASVHEGDIVARLDNTQVKASLGVVMADLNAQMARASRLLAERDDRPAVTFPADLIARAATDRDAATALQSERLSFESRRQARAGQKAQLLERVAQFEKEIESFNQQLKATHEQQAIAKQDRAILEPAIKGGFVQRPRVTALDREIERNKGIIGDASARIQQSEGRIRETRVQIEQIERDRSVEATKDLRETEAKIAELNERRIAADDQLKRAEIRAPVGGMVHELAVHTVGGVVTPGETLMTIVPDPDNLLVEVRLAPVDRDQIAVAKPARVRFTAFNQRITPELTGQVVRISPTTSRDQQSGFAYYTIGVRLLDGQLDKLHGSKLVPGMTGDTFITTESRTMVEYLTKQFADYFAHMFRGR